MSLTFVQIFWIVLIVIALISIKRIIIQNGFKLKNFIRVEDVNENNEDEVSQKIDNLRTINQKTLLINMLLYFFYKWYLIIIIYRFDANNLLKSSFNEWLRKF